MADLEPARIAESVRWWEWRKRRACPHPRLRCIHGDEINAVGGRRAQCLRCGRYLGPLPALCSVSGELHLSFITCECGKTRAENGLPLYGARLAYCELIDGGEVGQ